MDFIFCRSLYILFIVSIYYLYFNNFLMSKWCQYILKKKPWIYQGFLIVIIHQRMITYILFVLFFFIFNWFLYILFVISIHYFYFNNFLMSKWCQNILFTLSNYYQNINVILFYLLIMFNSVYLSILYSFYILYHFSLFINNINLFGIFWYEVR